MYLDKKYTIITLSSTFTIWILIEYILSLKDKKNLIKAEENIRDQLINNINKCSNPKRYINDIENDLQNYLDTTKEHVISSFKKSFNLSSHNLNSVLKNIQRYTDSKIKKDTNIVFDNDVSYLMWYPYIFRLFFTLSNTYQRNIWFLKYKLDIIHYEGELYYKITKKKNKTKQKTFIIFHGLGGILYSFRKIIRLLVKLNYQIIIPVYSPAQASLNFNFDCYEIKFYQKLYQFLQYSNINDVEILGWSLGGMLYKGFENYTINKNINITRVFLVEPLLGLRASLDTYFTKKRHIYNTISLIDSVTCNNYYLHNRILAYLFHTNVGYATGNSFGYFLNVELADNSFKYPRYLFVSSDDIIFNNKLEKNLISSNFDEEKVYFRTGYHGGWANSSRLTHILESIINNNFYTK